MALNTRIELGAALIAACGVMIVGAQQRSAGPYTAAQGQAGRAAYQANYAPCHAPDLSGREGPQLAGANFMMQWGYKTTGELIGFMRATMPPSGAAPLPDQTYADLAALILDANSARPGTQTLAANSRVPARPQLAVPRTRLTSTSQRRSCPSTGQYRSH